MAINWFWDTLQCKWPDPKPSALLASKGISLVSRVSSFETSAGALYASRSHFICDQTRELRSCADLQMGVGPRGAIFNPTTPVAAARV